MLPPRRPTPPRPRVWRHRGDGLAGSLGARMLGEHPLMHRETSEMSVGCLCAAWPNPSYSRERTVQARLSVATDPAEVRRMQYGQVAAWPCFGHMIMSTGG